ncbi:hypothetical protein [Deinococcus sp.]|uniref:TM2 domain-containing protein n=1 Tax=Deinococcus sp. TaxID=47478 RepID=UPI003CC51D6B
MTMLNDPLIHKAYSQLSTEDRLIFDSAYRQRSKPVGLAYLTWLIGWQYAYFNQWGVQFLYWFTIGGCGFWMFIDLFRIPGAVAKINKDIALEVLQHVKLHADSLPTYVMPGAPLPASALPISSSPALAVPEDRRSAGTVPPPLAPVFPTSTAQPVWLIPAGAVAVLIFGSVLWFGFQLLRARSQPTQATAFVSQSAPLSQPQTISATDSGSSPAPTAPTPFDSAPAANNPPVLSFVRPLADPVASGMPRLYDYATTMNGGDGKACALIDPGNPIKRCKVSVSSSGQYAWGSSWCAANAATLTRFLNHATLRYELDGQPIAVSQFWEGRSSTCLKRRLIVQNMPRGEQHELKLTITLDQGITDGGSRYPVGEYELSLQADGI